MTNDTSAGPLHTLRVLDLTGELGRYAGKLLAENGADVLRLIPGERGPDVVGADQPGLLQWWHDAGCRTAEVNLDDPVGQEHFRTLLSHCDVLLDGQSPQLMAARGLGPQQLQALHPRLVHISLTPQGSDGPRAEWRSSELVAQALGGYLSVTGDPDQPIALWGRQAATVGGFYAAISALAGVHRARTTGEGSWVDLSLHESLVSCSEHVLMYWWFAEALAGLGAPIAARQRSLHWIRAFEVVPCKRGACMVSPAAGGLLELIAWLKSQGHAMHVPDTPDDDQLLALVPDMMQALHDVALEHDATELFEAGQSLHVPFGEAYSISQVTNSPQHQHRGFFREVAANGDGGAPGIHVPGPLARFADSPAPPPMAPQPTTVDDAIADWGSGSPGDVAAASSEAPQAPSGALPLAGVRVLDLTHVLAGPFATRVMADLGADVIRVQTEERSGGASANDFPYQVMWGRSKRSIQLHMKHPEANDVLRKLVEHADVVVDNFSAEVMTGWGAGPEQLAQWNPSVISMSMSGCGIDGPWQQYVTYAPTVHALCGLTALTGPAGETDCGPGIAYNDHISGLAGAVALLSAIEHRARTGRGQHIEMSQYEVGTYLVGPALIDYLATGREALSIGNVDPFADYVVNDVFLAADGDWVAVTLADSADVDRIINAGIAAAGLDGADATDVAGAVRAWVGDRSAVAAQDELQAAGVAAGVVQNASHFANDDPQLAHRDWLVTMDSPMVGSQTTERHPGRWWSNGTELALPYQPSAYLGEHNFEVYEELLGWDAERIAVALGEELIL